MHIIDEVALTRNLEILRSIQERTGAKIILALKAFAQFSTFPLIRQYRPGATASSLSEARLVAGDAALFEVFHRKLQAQMDASRARFLAGKLAERAPISMARPMLPTWGALSKVEHTL